MSKPRPKLVSTLSILLCTAFIVLWVRSRRVYDNLIWCRSPCFVRLESAGGTCAIYWMTEWRGTASIGPHHRRSPVDPLEGGWDLSDGATYEFGQFAFDTTPTLVEVPGGALVPTAQQEGDRAALGYYRGNGSATRLAIGRIAPRAVSRGAGALRRMRLRPARQSWPLSGMRPIARGDSRMRRHLLNALTLASLVLCVASVALWAWSHVRLNGVLWVWTMPRAGASRGLLLYSGAGGVQFSFIAEETDPMPPAWPTRRAHSVHHWQEEDPEPAGSRESNAADEFRHEAWGFGIDRFRACRINYFDRSVGGEYPWLSPDRPPDARAIARTSITRRAWFPTWLLVVVFAALPARWIRHRGSALRRARRGLCVLCGYDLRASPGQCPECGGK